MINSRHQNGLAPVARQKKLQIAVIGAGASGIMAVVKLREAGHTDVRVFEKAASIGGTWRVNRYPGVACDVPSHLYRYSFAPNAEWSRTCSPGSEILAYLHSVYSELNIGSHVEFDTEVNEARYTDGKWTLETSSGRRGPFDVIITAMGILRDPTMPAIDGLNTFSGTMFHTGRWREDIDLTGKRVGIIGTGSTATQIVPAIADRVGKLHLFQRTPQWILPFPNTFIPEEERANYRRDPLLMESRYRELGHDFNSKFGAAVVGKNPRVYEHMVKLCEEHLRTVTDLALREKLRPDYKVGCKRLVLSDSFYQAIQKPNVELVTDRVVHVEPQGVRTNDGRLHNLDVLVLATGYDAHSPFAPMQVIGSDGLTIEQAWENSVQAYLAVAIPQFPNFLMIGGPNSPIGNFSFLMTAESQCQYIVRLVELLASGRCSAIAPTLSATAAFNEALQRQMSETVWTSGCKSWYKDKNGDISSWPWTYEEFERKMSEPKLDDFELIMQPDTRAAVSP